MKLHHYSDRWLKLYEHEAQGIKNVIGNSAKDIQHIGSTAIPHIMSKPIIDIMVLLTSMDRAEVLIERLAPLEYIFDKDASSSERYFFRKGEPVQYHLSLTDETATFWKRQLQFRDYLINHEAIAKEYEALKLKLIKKYPSAKQKYTDGKNEFVKKILSMAENDAMITARPAQL